LVIDALRRLKGLEIKSKKAIKSKDNKGTIHFFIDSYAPAQNEKLLVGRILQNLCTVFFIEADNFDNEN
jgi:hypothetical protein